MQTLQAMKCIIVPDGLKPELLVVDNGSTDETAEVVRSCQLQKLPVRYTYERQAGQARARNRGLTETTGEMVLFIDDDVRPSADWLAGMCEPMLQYKACAVAGGVQLAPGLVRPWMSPVHRSWLASSEWLDGEAPQSMVGANMGFSREVLRRVPAFDPELGPGALGFKDDSLFASQLLEAGYKIICQQKVSVEHHFDPSRLRRECWLEAATRRGKSHAYLGHHWEHWGCKLAVPRLLWTWCKLRAWRRRFWKTITEEGCSEEELTLVFGFGVLQAHLRERRRRRNYRCRGLVKLT